MSVSSVNGLTVAVTGADGFIGSNVVESLAAAGASVRALSLYNSFGTHGWLDSLAPEIRDFIDIRSGDVRDPFFVDQFVAGSDVVLHLAALIAIPFSYVAPQSYVEVNVTGTLNVLEACRKHGVRRMVHTSTSETYGTAQFTPITETHPMQGQSPYSASKIGADHMVEAYVRSFDVPAVILRPFNTFGPRQSERAVIPTVIRQALDPACAEIRLGDLSPVRDFNYVGDIAQAFLLAGTAQLAYGTAYNAGSGQAVTIREMVDMVKQATGTNKPVVEEAGRKRPSNSEVFELIAGADKFRMASGWKSEIGLETGLERTIAWWQEQVQAGKLRPTASYQV